MGLYPSTTLRTCLDILSFLTVQTPVIDSETPVKCWADFGITGPLETWVEERVEVVGGVKGGGRWGERLLLASGKL